MLMHICVIILVALFVYLWDKKRYYYLHWKLSGPFGLPFIGIALHIRNRERVINTLTNFSKMYSSPYVTWLGTSCILVANDPETMETILTSPHCLNKSFLYKFLREFIDDGLFTSNIPKWGYRAKLIKPAFKRKFLHGFFDIFNAEADTLVKKLEDHLSDENFSIYDHLKLSTLETACQTTLGHRSTLPGISYKNILAAFECVMGSFIARIFNPLLYDSALYKLTSVFEKSKNGFQDIVDILERQIRIEKSKITTDVKHVDESMDENESRTLHTFAEYITNNKDDLSVEDIREEITVLIAAAYETTAISLYIVICCLAMNPDHQERVFEEVLAICPEDDFEVTKENINDLVYTEMCINESLRVIPPVPVVGRLVGNDVLLKNGVTVPKGTEILLDIFNMQRSTKHWGPTAKRFNPENFLPENVRNRHSYSYIPFTKGIRMCIGFQYATMLMKIFVAKIFRNYKISTETKIEDLVFIEDISIKIKNHPKFKIEKRNI